MRSGTRSQCKTRWTPRRHRPRCRLKLGYEYVYLYVAINPYSGVLFSLLLPDMTKACFSVFNHEFCRWLEHGYGSGPPSIDKPVLFITDGAGSHQDSVCRQCGIDLVKLPPASPELNPAERFFEELRKELANHVFADIEEVSDFMVAVLKKYFQNPEKVAKLTQFPYIM